MQKTVVVCDSCGKQADADGRVIVSTPAGWFVLRQNAEFVPLDLCSLECVQAVVQKAAAVTTAPHEGICSVGKPGTIQLSVTGSDS